MRRLIDAWFDLLELSVPVYKIDVPLGAAEPYVWIYPESGNGNDNKTSLADEVVVVVQVVSRFNANINSDVVESISEEIEALVKPTASSHGISATGIQVLNVRLDSYSYVSEQDGTEKIYSKIMRYANRINKS